MWQLYDKDLWRSGHRDRLRAKAEILGWKELKPFEMIELILYYAVPRQDVSKEAKALIKRFGTVDGVLRADRARLMKVPGVSKAMADWLANTGQLVGAYNIARKFDFPLICLSDVIRFLKANANCLTAPSTRALYTDFEDCFMTWSTLSRSTRWWEPEQARQLVREAVALEARHLFIVVYTGDSPFSLDCVREDRLLLFARTMKAIDVDLLDFILVGGGAIYSMNASGRMDAIRDAVRRMMQDEYVLDELFTPGED